MLDLNQFSGKDKAEILHSSGHAQLGRGSQIGATGGLTFEQRLSMTGQGRTIADYRRSLMGAQRGTLRARQATPESLRLRRSSTEGGQSRQAFNAGDTSSSQPSTGFKEPPSRGYNPYA